MNMNNNVLYSNYRDFENSNNFFTNSYFYSDDEVESPWEEGYVSLTGLAQKSLQYAHNQLADQINNGKISRTSKNIEIGLIGAGFASTAIIGVIEVCVRVVLGAIGLLFSLITLNQVSAIQRFTVRNIFSIFYTPMMIGLAGASLFSHLRHSESRIDYEGQANCLLFHQKEKNKISYSVKLGNGQMCHVLEASETRSNFHGYRGPEFEKDGKTYYIMFENEEDSESTISYSSDKSDSSSSTTTIFTDNSETFSIIANPEKPTSDVYSGRYYREFILEDGRKGFIIIQEGKSPDLLHFSESGYIADYSSEY